MGLEKLIKREISITIAVVLLVTTVFIMFSYAIFKVEVTGEQNVITMGDINLSFCQDAACDSTISNIGNIIGTKTITQEDGTKITKYVPVYPQKDPTTEQEWSNLTPYVFKLENTGSIDLYISLYLTKESTVNLTGSMDESVKGQNISNFTESVSDDQIKIAIGEQGSNPTTKLFSSCTEKNVIGETKGREIATNIEIKAKTSKIFNLYAWLKEDAVNAAQGKYFVTQITARGEYKPEDVTTTPDTPTE